MSNSYAGPSPKDILAQATLKAQEAEQAILASLGLDQSTSAIEALQKDLGLATKRQARVAAECVQLRDQIRVLRAQQEEQLKGAMDAGVSVSSLVELTKRDRATISRIKNAHPSLEDTEA